MVVLCNEAVYSIESFIRCRLNAVCVCPCVLLCLWLHFDYSSSQFVHIWPLGLCHHEVYIRPAWLTLYKGRRRRCRRKKWMEVGDEMGNGWRRKGRMNIDSWREEVDITVPRLEDVGLDVIFPADIFAPPFNLTPVLCIPISCSVISYWMSSLSLLSVSRTIVAITFKNQMTDGQFNQRDF